MDVATRRKTLRLLSNGVYIITARDGDDFGAATVTWLSQASFKPPLLMAAVRADSNVFKCLSRSGAAAVHIVDRSQQEIAQRFFTPTCTAAGSINGEPFRGGKTAAPILENMGAYLECRLKRIMEGEGDHAIVLLEVKEAECHATVSPLTIRESPWEYGG
jgi:flavin reductase (DIM6/NTAB) family NADH-FMN oxidoreductase RutF